jgi:D-inositol-3-phosphate glycosyltransferase
MHLSMDITSGQGKRQATNWSPSVAILTGGSDKPYALGLAYSLIAEDVEFDFIGSDYVDSQELRASRQVRVMNLRGDMNPNATLTQKCVRVVRYYFRLLCYAISAKPKIFHILWNNKFEVIDRTLLLVLYRFCGRRVVLTVHNVNIRKRDGKDGVLNRLTLRIQYRLAHHLFVHTEVMKRELESDFAVPREKISVIPFGINSTVPDTTLDQRGARRRLGLEECKKIILFYGFIAPYKGLNILVESLARVVKAVPDMRLIIAGRPKFSDGYWETIEHRIDELGLRDHVVTRIEFVPDDETEVYFKSADALVLPYLDIFQSGVLFLGFNFGLPVIASDVGSLKDDIIEGETGYMSKPGDVDALADAIERYFASDLYRNLELLRPTIRRFVRERHSWTKVAAVTKRVYDAVLRAA